MEAVGLALSVAQALFTALQSSELNHVLSIFGYESELEKLQSTVERITAVLEDAEGKEELTFQERDLVRKLKAAVYDADDLVDKFRTLAEQEQLLLQVKKGGKLRRKVRRLISRFGKLGDAYDMTREVREIREKLEGISSDANKFKIKVDSQPLRKRREETCSYVYQNDIIGREDDVKNVIDMLLADDDNAHAEGNILIVSIVGMGGLGKTALAQLVFNDDKRIKDNFPLKLWACVADEDIKFEVKAILGKILKSDTDDSNIDSLGIERLNRKVREKLDGKKYLLVLDDIWTENRIEWMKLENFLKGSCLGGSRIVVTTRSVETAKAVGNRAPYMLKGLSEKASWHLFRMVALGQEQEHLILNDFVKIGRDIVRKCANVPLAIRVVGSLLFGQDIDKWQAIGKKGLASIGNDKNGITPILKLSYSHLESPLKSCFTYCALFPKDTVMEKQNLISLWMAQGYLQPLNGDQNLENVGEEYFSILLRRCFFQDVTNNGDGEIWKCKIHDLLHDIAQEVAGKEICVAGDGTGGICPETRHVYHHSGEQNYLFSTQNRSRTYLNDRIGEVQLGTLFANCKFLRSLEISGRGLKKVLPGTIGELLHLRYLNLSYNWDLEMLPVSITKLHNLLTLHLESCVRLKELPHDLNKLAKLRALNIKRCDGLTYMPSGMGKLTCLNQLTMFVLGRRNPNLKQQQQIGDIQDLHDLRNLKGSLIIKIMEGYEYTKGKSKGGYLCNKEHLCDFTIEWANPASSQGRFEEGEAEELLETLQPHHNLKELKLLWYPGARMPGWARENNLITFFPNLTQITIMYGPVSEVTSMSKLLCLKKLVLFGLKKLEYVENNTSASVKSATYHREAVVAVGSKSYTVGRESSIMFFPSLEALYLTHLPKFKGWWRSDRRLEVRDDQSLADDDDDDDDDSINSKHFLKLLPSFPRLEILKIQDCPNLIYMPLCPTVRDVELTGINEKLRIMEGDDEEGEGICSTSSSELPAHQNSGKAISPRLRELTTDDSECLRSLPRWAIYCLEELRIYKDKRPILSGLFGEVFSGYPNSIRIVQIRWCYNLKSVFGVLDHLSGLEHLQLTDLPNLTFEDVDGENEDGMPWKSFANTLQVLNLDRIPKVMKLPKGIQQLTSLRKLQISNCTQELEERCRRPDGEDWPLIQHVPDILVTTSYK